MYVMSIPLHTVEICREIATEINGNPENEVCRGKDRESFIKFVRIKLMTTEVT